MTDDPRVVLRVVLALLAAASVGVLIGRPVQDATSADAVAAVAGLTTETEAAHEPITVHVAGAVAEPGLVRLEGSPRVADAVSAAGGALPDANLGSVNLAESVVDGQRVFVPGPGEGGPVEATGDGRLHVNRADVAELESLPGVGPVLAANIVAHRDEHGPFRSVEDLLSVPGIGEAKLAALRDSVVVP